MALFWLKDPSLLAFQRSDRDPNLRSVFGLSAISSDTQFRTILDDLHPQHLRQPFRTIFWRLQRDKVLLPSLGRGKPLTEIRFRPR